MTAEIISVGTELLMGNVVNTDAQLLSEECAMLGLTMYYQSVVDDNRERLEKAISIALERSDNVILTGGLGPADDDLTAEACASVMGLPLVEDRHTRERVEENLRAHGITEIPDRTWKQAMVPEGAAVLDNENGTAPGIVVKKDGKTVVMLPGPPDEMMPIFRDKARNYLTEGEQQVIRYKVVKVCSLTESSIAYQLKDLFESQTNPTLATYVKTGEIHILVTARAAGEKEALALLTPVVEEIKRRLGIAVYTTDEDETLEMVVVDLLKKYDITVSTAESCTGGMIAAQIVNVPGASDVFRAGFVTYSNHSKRKLLDVKKSTIKEHGAVSEETVREMAKGGVFATDSDICIAVTGVAGPGGGTPDKPVGLVYIATYMKDQLSVEEYHFNGNRQKIRAQATKKALDLLRRSILENYSE